jgi:hypothetical protein
MRLREPLDSAGNHNRRRSTRGPRRHPASVPSPKSLVHRGRRCARVARREAREYREYLSVEQRSQPGCSVGRMPRDFGLGTLIWNDLVKSACCSSTPVLRSSSREHDVQAGEQAPLNSGARADGRVITHRSAAFREYAASVVAEVAIATVDHSDIRGSKPHNRDPSGAASD